MAGSPCHPGGAISGGAGYIAAGLIARDLGIKPWWQPWDARAALENSRRKPHERHARASLAGRRGHHHRRRPGHRPRLRQGLRRCRRDPGHRRAQRASAAKRSRPRSWRPAAARARSRPTSPMPDSVAAMAKAVEQEFGRIDILINNAAHLLHAGDAAVRPDPAGGMGGGAAGQRHRRVPVRPRRGRRDAPRQLRPHHQHGVGRGDARAAELPALHHLEGGARRHDPVAGARARAARDHRQRHPAGRDLHRDRAQDRHAGAKRADRRHAMHRAAGGSRRTWSAPPCSWPPTPPPS